MLAGVADCRRSRKWGCKGRWALGLKPRPGSHRKGGPQGFGRERRGSCSFGEVKGRGPRGSVVNRKDHAVLRGKEEDHAVLKGKEEDHEVLECFFLQRSLGSRRDFAGKKRGERTLAGGP